MMPPIDENTPTDQDLWVLWSNDHGAFWRENACGYTQDVSKAGRFSREFAEAVVASDCKRSSSTLPRDVPAEVMLPAPKPTSPDQVTIKVADEQDSNA